ncbi:MAG TPA: 2-octaprenyl-6-methoxyphenyl hydroxylase [Rhodanobacteraceae bacterium]|jgi:2-octaprenyl-6-methoxyphenol hydroxylase|nr:2-octaprenyl-6-methoxyphenyl hydroxylase [Rhodanobacteraceae bacterium]
MVDDCDVLIAGGGLVGASLAIALDGSGLSIALAEAVPPRVELQPSYDERNLALAGASVNALEALGVLDVAVAVHPIERIHVSRRGDFGSVRFDASELGLRAFGATIPARELGNALLRGLDRCRDLARLTPAEVVAVETHDDRIDVTLRTGEDERTIRTRLLVGADGTESFVRRAIGIDVERHDYGQCAFVTTLTVDKPLAGDAYERFTESGPVALLPLGANRAGLVLSVPATEAARIGALDDADFIAFVHARFGHRAGRFSRPGKRKPYPLARALASRTIAPRAVLVGNAAQTVHPIGAQGFNLGLRDALTLSEILRESAAPGFDAGEAGLLARYSQRRAGDRSATTRFSDELVRLMGSDFAPMRALRSLGFHALDRIAPLKRRFALRGMGFRGDTPLLALMR